MNYAQKDHAADRFAAMHRAADGESQVIRASNRRLWAATQAARFATPEDRPAARSEVLDARNQRQVMRERARAQMPRQEAEARAAHYEQQLRLWGRIEETYEQTTRTT